NKRYQYNKQQMKHIQLKIYLALLCLMGALGAYAQQIPQSVEEAKNIVKDRKLRISGGVNASQVFYGASGIKSRRNPYAYFLTGNINFSMFQMSIPLTFTFTNQVFNYNYQLPTFDFNQFGIQPSWKWIKIYAGYNTMSFSPYTLNGALFLGGGVELTPPPGKVKIEAMYGRLRKSQAFDPLADANTEQAPFAYHRMGYGTKITWKPKGTASQGQSGVESRFNKDGGDKNGNKKQKSGSSFFSEQDQFEFIVFGAHDDPGSVSPPPDSVDVKPEDNLVLSLRLTKSIGKRLTLRAEVAGSALTQDTRIETKDEEVKNLFFLTDGAYTRRTSTAYYNAYKGDLTYNAGIFNIGVGYERVDPEYRTLGGYYFNNDLENMTVNFSTQLFRNRLSIATNVGTQRNNLNNDQLATLRRVSAAVNVNVVPSPTVNVNLSYSNFQSLTQVRSQFEQINQLTAFDNLGDSLNLTQIAQNANLNANFNLVATAQQQQALNINVAYQQADNEQGGTTLPGTTFYQLTSAYNIAWTKLEMSASLAFNYNQNIAESLDTRMLGPTLTLNKSLFKRQLTLVLSASFNQAFTNGAQTNQVMNGRLGIGYTVMQKHRFSFNAIYLNQETQTEQTSAFSEFTGTLNYSYGF
ncbi:MAG TPA: hypothetical protein DCS93_27800, partial [Microscillaceae bacterium]|nr:hypothetical protein [Microscillaceae bacterium]